MPSTVEKLSPSRVKLTVEIPFADLKPFLDKAYREIAQQVTIPGFRKGKVPAAVIDQRFGRGMVLQEAINDALSPAYQKALGEAQVVPLGEPEIEVTRLEDGSLVEFTADVDVRPDFDIPSFANLSAVVDTLRDTDADVQERIEILRARFATTTEVSRAAADGDVVTIDLEGSRDGEVLPDATAESITYRIGSGGMLDGLDEAVLGLSAGESAEFTSTLVGGPFEGEPADIKVTVTKVSERHLPDVDDDFASMVSEFDTVEEMRADLATRAAELARLDQAAQGRDRLLEALIERTDFEVPERVLSASVEARRKQVTEQLGRAGLSLERYLEQAQEEAQTPDEFWAGLAANTLRGLKAQLILDKIADDREVGVEQADLSQLLLRKAAQNNTSPEQEAQHMMEHDHIGEWMQEIRRDKALDLILAEASVVDGDGSTIVLRGTAHPVEDDAE